MEESRPSKVRRTMPPEECNTNEITSKTFDHLDDALLGTILEFLAPGHFRFVASVNRRFRKIYPGPAKTWYSIAMTSDRTRYIWLEEDERTVSFKGCEIAAKCGSLETLQLLRSRNYNWDHFVVSAAVQAGHLHVLQWSRSQHPPRPWDSITCAAAAASGQLEVLQWLRSQTPPCPWDEWACANAAKTGRLEVLQWLRSQTPPCPWNSGTCAGAARYGQLEVLQWLRSQTPPCRWNYTACYWAASNGHVDTLRWLRSQTPPCPWYIRDCYNVAKEGSEMEAYILSQM